MSKEICSYSFQDYESFFEAVEHEELFEFLGMEAPEDEVEYIIKHEVESEEEVRMMNQKGVRAECEVRMTEGRGRGVEKQREGRTV